MSSGVASKRRCIIKKLDFENCILSSLKTKARRRKKLRARITREVEDVDEGGSSERPPANASPVLKRKNRREASPVLTSKQIKRRESPVFLYKQKPRSKETEERLPQEEQTRGESPPSPVFKVANNKFLHSNRGLNIDNITKSTPSSQNSYQIENTTQESSQNIHISSVESENVKIQSSGNYSVETKSETNGNSDTSGKSSAPDCWEEHEHVEKPRRNYKKNSLLGRLQKLLQKQASEKLLWQYQNRRNSGAPLKVSTITAWSQDTRVYIKCRTTPPQSETLFLLVDSEWVPNVKKVREGTLLQLHPPWQKIQCGELAIPVLLNIICLEIFNEPKEVATERQVHESVPASKFVSEEKSFVESLFSSHVSGFLY